MHRQSFSKNIPPWPHIDKQDILESLNKTKFDAEVHNHFVNISFTERHSSRENS